MLKGTGSRECAVRWPVFTQHVAGSCGRAFRCIIFSIHNFVFPTRAGMGMLTLQFGFALAGWNREGAPSFNTQGESRLTAAHSQAEHTKYKA